MADWLIAWSLRHRVVVLLAAVAVAAAGVVSVGKIAFDAFPDTTPVQVQINTAAPALVPEEIERLITYPIELAVAGLPGLGQVRSVSQFGLSSVVVTFNDGTDIYFARQLIHERMAGVEMPLGIDRPRMGPVATGLGEIFQYTLTSDELSLTELRTLHDWVIKPKMRSVPGVAEINSWGGLEKQYQIRIDPARLVAHDISFDEVVTAVRANNRNVGGGNIDENETGEMLLVEGIGRTANVGELENIVIRAEQGVPICVRDVAQVTIGHQIRTGTVTSGGKGEVVLGLGFMLMGQNSYAVTRALKERLEEVKKTLPGGVEVTTVYDRSELVEQVIATVRSSLSEGALLVVAVVFFFLGNLRAGLIVALAIPLSMLFAFSGMVPMGIAGTLLSLGAIDFGIVVDSCIVVVENIIEHLAADPAGDRLEIVRRATSEVRQPAIFGQLIIAVVYLPILTLEGVEGKMFRPMAWTVILVLTGSLLVSLTLVPVLASFLLRRGTKHHASRTVGFAERVYTPLLRRALASPIGVSAAAVALLLTAGVVAGGLGSEFVPSLSEGDIVIGIRRPAGTDLAESTRINGLMEKTLLAEFSHEVLHVWSRNGAPEVATDAGDVQTTDMFVALRPRGDWRVARTQAELVAKMHAAVGQLPGQTTWFTQPIEQRINEMVSGVRSDVAVKLFGDDFDTLVAEARRLEGVLATVPGCQDLAVEQIQGQPALRIKVLQDQIARYGLPVDRVLDVVEAVGSKSLGEVIEGERRVPLVARLPEGLCHSAAQLASVILLTPLGERLPLDHLAKIEKTFGPKMISRESSHRRITVQCNVRGRDVGSFVAEAQQAVQRQIQLPRGYRLQWGGQFENIERAQQRLLLVVPLSLALITGLLFLAYRTAGDALVVLASVPMACAGGVIALALRQMPLSISATVGFITLSGVSVLNSMVILSAVRLRTAAGLSITTAIFQAMTSRLRTVMMTTLVASAGFAPMAFSEGVGAEVQRPLATVVIGGVLSSTLLTLFVLPVLYAAMRRRWPIGEPGTQGSTVATSEPADFPATLTTV
ncbi:MAG TPA: CusA/CzcA family heavy metal efflux RND transporter [Pirellulales bacterium]